MLEVVRHFPKPPVGGWVLHVHDRDFRGSSPDQVIEEVTRYRLVNALPPGDPEQELAAAFRGPHPHLVREVPGVPQPRTDRQRVAENTAAIWAGRIARLPALDRGIVDHLVTCRACPHRRMEFAGAATAYADEMQGRAALLAGDPAVAQDGWCDHHFQWCGVIARLTEPRGVSVEPIPTECFVQ